MKRKGVSLRLNENEYTLLKKIAISEGRNLSDYMRRVLMQSIRQDMRDLNLLKQLLDHLETLMSDKGDFQVLAELNKFKFVVFELFKLFGEMFFVDATKRQKFLQELEKLKERIE